MREICVLVYANQSNFKKLSRELVVCAKISYIEHVQILNHIETFFVDFFPGNTSTRPRWIPWSLFLTMTTTLTDFSR